MFFNNQIFFCTFQNLKIIDVLKEKKNQLKNKINKFCLLLVLEILNADSKVLNLNDLKPNLGKKIETSDILDDNENISRSSFDDLYSTKIIQLARKKA